MKNTSIKSTLTIFIILLLFIPGFHPINAESDIHLLSKIKNDTFLRTQNGKKTESINELMNSSWPMYCHDLHHTGQSQYSTITNTGGIIWKAQVQGGIDSSPAIGIDGTIYVGGTTYYGPLYAFNRNGSEKWHFDTGFWVTSSPAIADDSTIYVGSWDDYFYAINPNGTQKWRFYTGVVKSSPAIANDRTIYIGSITAKCLFAIQPNGTLKWRFNTSDYIEGAPAIGDDTTVYITSNNNVLYALFPENGSLKWQFSKGGFLGSPALGDDGTIYVASQDGYLYAVYQNGTMKWKSPIGWGSGHVPSIASDGTIYIGGDDLYAIYPNGTRKWTFNLGRFYDVTSESQAVSADGTIYFGVSNSTGTGGYLIAVNPDGMEKWREWIHNDHVWSSPAIGSDGTVYIGASLVGTGFYGILYAFNEKKFENPVIEKPLQGKLYLFNKETISTLSGKTIVIGKITIEVTHPDPVNITKIEFYLDGMKQYEDTTPPYQWTWRGLSFGHHNIMVTAVNTNNITKSTNIDVWKFF